MAVSIQEFFPFLPTQMSWDDWNGNLCMYYGREPVPHDPDENNWRAVAKSVADLSTFAAYPVPDADLYDSWQEWALDFTEIINGPSY